VERRGEGLTSNTVTSNEQSRHPKMGIYTANFRAENSCGGVLIEVR
jgi:hypothetical protein